MQQLAVACPPAVMSLGSRAPVDGIDGAVTDAGFGTAIGAPAIPKKAPFAFGYGSQLAISSREPVELSTDPTGRDDSDRGDDEEHGGYIDEGIVQPYLNAVHVAQRTREKPSRVTRVDLERGQSEVVRFELGPDDLTLHRPSFCRPITESGEFQVMVDGSSRKEDLLEARLTLLGR